VVRNNLGAVISNPAVTWSFPSASVAALLPTGAFASTTAGPTSALDTMRLRAVALGSATLTAIAGGASATVAVTVTNDPASLDIVPTAGTTVSLLDTLFPAVAFLNGRGASLPRTAVTWSSDNTAIATVSADGVITGVAVGTTKVRAVSPASPAVKDSISVTITNVPASVVLSPAGPDTMLAAGQQLSYSATVRNARNDVISGGSATWSSSATGVATIDATSGVATAVADGSTNVTATSGSITSSPAVLQVTLDPADIYVSKDSSVTPKLGTRRRPFSRIQDGINLAGPGDNVWVQRSATAYAESLVTAASITLRGQDTTLAGCTASGCTTPANLPALAHNYGSAAIRTASGTTFTLRHLAITHNVDGPAVDANGTDLVAEFVYVNPSAVAAQGRGFLVRNVPVAATIRKSQVRQVRGYGIRLENSSNSSVDSVSISAVTAVAGVTDSAGVHVTGGSGNRVAHTTISGGVNTDGLRLSSTSNARIRGDSVNGGRYGLYAENSTWLDTSLAVRSATAGFVLGASNTVTSDSARIGQTSDAGVILSGANNAVTLRTIRTDTVATGTDSAAIDARSAATGARLTITGGRLRTASRRAVRMATGAALVMRNDTIVGPGSGAAVDSTLAVVTAATTLSDSVSVARTVIKDFPGRFALNVAATNRVHVDSNDLARNRRGINVGSTPASFRVLHNDIYDHVDAVALTSATSTNVDSVLQNWFGDSRGPRRFVLTGGVANDTLATGDSVDLASAAFTSGDFAALPGPHTLINGASGAAASVRLVRGSGQTLASSGTPSNALLRLTARVVDANGRPVSGATVSFTFVGCSTPPDDDLGFAPTDPGGPNCTNVSGTSNADGLAEAILEVDGGAHTVTVNATVAGLNTVTFTVTRN
jgi:hypothetical protein